MSVVNLCENILFPQTLNEPVHEHPVVCFVPSLFLLLSEDQGTFLLLVLLSLTASSPQLLIRAF